MPSAPENELLQAFLLGNAAILTNVCMLPLYPGLIAFMAGTSANGRAGRSTRWLGLAVFAGVMSLMVGIGALLYRLQASFGDVLGAVLPVVYGVVAVLGVAMLLGRNPFTRMGSLRIPGLSHPLAAAFVYGMLLAPMTLPCVGPVVLSAFLLGAGSTATLISSVLYFLAFGLGFGWPLVALPFLAQPVQRRLTGALAHHHHRLTMASGALLVLIALFGLVTEVIPNMT